MIPPLVIESMIEFGRALHPRCIDTGPASGCLDFQTYWIALSLGVQPERAVRKARNVDG
jgi:hypothetical protein